MTDVTQILSQIESGDPSAAAQLLQVVGFRVEISRWEAKWKPGQNHSSSRRRRTIAALNEQPDKGAREIAALMQATLFDADDSDVHPG